jgi:hypothetical protein
LITPAKVLSTGLYRLRLRGTGGGVLASIDSQILVVDSQQQNDVALNFTVMPGESE